MGRESAQCLLNLTQSVQKRCCVFPHFPRWTEVQPLPRVTQRLSCPPGSRHQQKGRHRSHVSAPSAKGRPPSPLPPPTDVHPCGTGGWV